MRLSMTSPTFQPETTRYGRRESTKQLLLNTGTLRVQAKLHARGRKQRRRTSTSRATTHTRPVGPGAPRRASALLLPAQDGGGHRMTTLPSAAGHAGRGTKPGNGQLHGWNGAGVPAAGRLADAGAGAGAGACTGSRSAFAAEGDALLDALLGGRDGSEAGAADLACGPGQSAPPRTGEAPAADDSRNGVPDSAHPASAEDHAPLDAAESGARLRGVTVMAPGEYFPRLWAHCAPVAELAESLATAAAAAAAEGARPGAAATYRAHLGEAALEAAVAAGAVVLVRRPASLTNLLKCRA